MNHGVPVHYQGPTDVSDNVITDGRPQVPNDATNPQTGAIWGLDHKPVNGTLAVNDNIVANILDNRGVNMQPYSAMTPNQFGTGNIARNWVKDSFPSIDPG